MGMTSCYHEFPGGGGGGGGGGTGTAKVSLTLVADTLPANLGMISFRVNIRSVVLTSSTGAQTTLNLGGLNNGNGLVVDLARAQSDSIFLGTVSGVPTGTISSITVALSGAELAFFNGTGAAITNMTPQCPASAVCVANVTVSGSPIITGSQTISGNAGFGIDFNLASAITVNGGSLSVNFTNSGNTNVLSAFALPRTGSNLTAGQLDLIEDFTGTVTLAGTGVTITSGNNAGRGAITAASSATTNYDVDPSQTLCSGATSLSSCVSSNQAASMDAILNSDGTFTVQEIEPLLASPVVDTVEGTVVFVNSGNQSQFGIIVNDIIPAATNSKVGTINIGDPLTVNLANVVGTGFLVDTKGLAVSGFTGNFAGGTTNGSMHLGQSVAAQVTAFTAASGNNPASVTSDLATLRFSRFIAVVNVASGGSSEFSINGLPGYFGFTPTSIFDVQTFAGTQGGDGITNLDGVTSAGALVQAKALAIRALFIEDAGNTIDPPFFAAKIRQH
jgi:hypothetical protein